MCLKHWGQTLVTPRVVLRQITVFIERNVTKRRVWESVSFLDGLISTLCYKYIVFTVYTNRHIRYNDYSVYLPP